MSEEFEPKRRSGMPWAVGVLWVTAIGGIWFLHWDGARRDAEISGSQQELLVWAARGEVNQSGSNCDSALRSALRSVCKVLFIKF